VVLIGAILAQIAVAVPLQAFRSSRFLTLNLSVMAGCIWWIVAYQRLSRTRGWPSLKERFSPVGGSMILIGALAGAFLALLPWGLAEVLELAGVKIPDVPVQAVLPRDLGQLPLAIAVVVVLGPLSEELIFRGLMLDWLRPKMSGWPAALVISVLFALLHSLDFKGGWFVWIAFGTRFLLGMGASYFAMRCRSLRASFAMHAALNGCACLSTASMSL
jgi:membrane protease YdiL (CAAX protease family)